MAKQLSIVVTAKDQASAAFRKIASDTLKIGDHALRVMRSVAAPFKALIGSLTSVRTLIAGTLGVLAARRILGSFNAATVQIDEMAKAAQRLQIGVEQLSSLKFTADLANVSFEQLTSGLATAQKNLGQFAITGGGRAAEAIRLLGVRVRDADGGVRSMTDLLPEMADALNAIPDAGRRGFLASRIFGENGPEFLNLMAEGGDRLRTFNEQARALGAIISPETARIAEEYRDAITRVQAAWLGLRARLLADVGPALTDLTNRFASFIAAVPEMVGNLMKTVRTAFSNGPESDAARDALLNMFASWGGLLKSGLVSAGYIALGVTSAVLDMIFGEVDSRIRAWVHALPGRMWQWAQEVNATFGAKLIGLVSPDMKALLEATRDLDRIGFEMEASRARTKMSMEQFGRSIETDFPQISAAIAASREEMRAAGAAAFTATDQVLGFVEAMAKTAIVDLGGRPDRPKDGDPKDVRWRWSEFGIGWKKAWADYAIAAKDAYAQGIQMGQAVAETLTGTLSTAINGVIQGTKSMKDAFREFASDTLRQISEIIVRLLVMRAIGGVASSALGGEAGVAAAAGAYAKGGVFSNGRVMRFAAGGILASGMAGYVVDRPTVFPMARGGVGLMGEAGPEAVLPLRRGPGGKLGVEASGGGGDTYVFNITVPVHSKADKVSASEYGRAVYLALRSEMRRNPSARDELRSWHT